MDWITGISKAIDYIEEHITCLLYTSDAADYVRMRRLTLAGEELLSPELVWAPVLFILRKGGKNVILIEESNIERKTL